MKIRALFVLLTLTLLGCSGTGIDPSIETGGTVDDSALINPDDRPQDWLTHGRTYSEQRFSPLSQINEQNVGELGLVWSFDTDTDRGLEATPIVVDGTLYTTGSWSVVFAVNAATGELTSEVPPDTMDIHAIWGDGTGLFYAVGGRFYDPYEGVAYTRTESE